MWGGRVDDCALIVRFLGQNDAPVGDDCDSLIHTRALRIYLSGLP